VAAIVGVILAAAGMFLTNTVWPDITVGLLITGLFLVSASRVLRQAIGELRNVAATAKHAQTAA
jgi:Co/Zn/Cd efflux system component